MAHCSWLMADGFNLEVVDASRGLDSRLKVFLFEVHAETRPGVKALRR